VGNAKGKDTKINSKEPVASKEQSGKIIVYYFHGYKRCYSCKQIEKLTREALTQAFQKEMDQGRLEWRVINIDDKENRHFIKDYQLYTRTVIVSEIHEEKEVRWKNLEEVWKWLKHNTLFKKYIIDEVKVYLGKE
jgi:hypothetical protein